MQFFSAQEKMLTFRVSHGEYGVYMGVSGVDYFRYHPKGTCIFPMNCGPRFLALMATRNPARKPVEVGSEHPII